jgi:hypothetical protein
MVLLLGLGVKAAIASGACPPSPEEGIEGEIRCGHIQCGRLEVNSWYIGGKICKNKKDFICMVDCLPMRPLESAKKAKIEEGHLVAETIMRTQDGRVWDGQPGRVKLWVNGHPTLEGRFKRGTFYWDNGTTTQQVEKCDAPEN